jgi:glycosyltransferase involved in cell wall biosynthesis
MNIIYINHYAGSVEHGMEYRPYYLAREWVKLGHSVTIIASSFSHLRQKNIDIQNGTNYLHETIDGINYIWCKTSAYGANGIKRVFNIFEFLSRVKKLIPQLIILKPDMVIASSTYPFDTRVAKKISDKAGAKFVYEVHDLWPLTPMELGGMSKYHPFIWLMQRAEDFAYKHADTVVSLLPKAKNYMCEHGMGKDKFLYIPNGVVVNAWLDNQDKLPQLHIDKISEIKNNFKFLIGYAGGMGESNALEYLVKAAKNVPDVAFVLVGDGANKAQLVSQIQQEKVPNIFFLPRISKNQVAAFLNLMDALYIGWHKLPIYRFGICPNKIFDYMLAKKPILHSVTAGNDLVAEANCGISVSAQDVQAIIEAINKLKFISKESLKTLGENGYSYVIKHHDYAILAESFLKGAKI